MDEVNTTFCRAKPIWRKSSERELNEICAFYTTFKSYENLILRITASNFYSAYINGELISFGPARASHGNFRIDELHIKANKAENSLFIIVAGYHADTYWALNQDAFLQAEILVGGQPILWTGRDFSVRRYYERTQKVCRFSFQRSFIESYNFVDNPIKTYCDNSFDGEEPAEVSGGTTTKRHTHYPKYEFINSFNIENGYFTKIFDAKYDNLCFYKPQNSIYDKSEWKSDPSSYVYNLKYTKYNNSACKAFLSAQEYSVYDFTNSETGFIDFNFKALSDAKLYVIFDEIDLKEEINDNANILFYRNNCINIIEYNVKKGEYNHCTFEPYSARYVKILVVSGEICDIKVNMILYKNPDAHKFSFTCENKKLEKIIQASVRTFEHNAVDLLTDCPSRERAGWLCDSYFSAQAEQLFTGENLVEYDFLQNYALAPNLSNIPADMPPMCYPAEFEERSYIPNWAMWYIIELYDNFLRTGNYDMAKLSEKKVNNILKFFDKYLNEYGLLENLESWIFVEWSKANDDEFVKGVNFPSNMLYSKALYCAGKLYYKDDLIDASNRIKENIIKLSFNGEFFEDNCAREKGKLARLGHITETCQYYAFFTGVASVERFPVLFDTIVNKFGAKRDSDTVYSQVYKSNAFIGNYLRLIMLCENGQKNRIENECIDFFYEMAIRTGTLWEKDNPSASLDHGFASYVCNIIVDYLCGYKGRKNNVVIFSQASSSIDCEIHFPLDDGNIVFTRIDGREKITVSDKYILQRI